MAILNPSPQDWKEARRWRALELKQQGWKQRPIAEALGVTESAVSQWFSAVEAEGQQALRARPRPGAPPKLTAAQRRLIPEFLSHGAEAYGFRGEVWTCARVASVIRQEFGVAYHKSHVSRLLKQLDWTPQKPLRQVTRRDETVIENWRTRVWEELKKKHTKSAARLSLWMNRAFTCCPRWSEPMRPVGRRPSCVPPTSMPICR